MRAVLVATCVLAVASPALAQRLALPRVLREALPRPDSRWPRHPLGGGVLPDAETLDHALAATRLDAARTHFGADGTGATVCVIDTGVDTTHPLLCDAAGHTRLRAVVDLDAAPRPDETDIAARALADAAHAAVWSAASIDAGAATPGDPWGHGTAVAALVARGAPGAAIVVVKALRAGSAGFVDEDIERAAAACVLASDPARTVIVLSLGGHDGAHDGTEPLEEALAALPALVVAAAGNDSPDGAAPHARVVLGADDVAISVHVPSPGPFALGPTDDGERSVSIVVVAGDGAEVALEAPDGTRTDFTAPGHTSVVDAPGARLAVEGAASPRPGGVRVVYAVIAGGAELPPLHGGRYALHVRGSGVLDAWLADSQLAGPLSAPGFVGAHADHEDTVTIPATSSGVLAVGAIATAPVLGTLVLDDALPGVPASFSARGPRRDLYAKPDLAAPGAWVVSALSRDVTGGDAHDVTGGSPARLHETMVGDTQLALLGTSFAAPLAAAALALALGDHGGGPSRGATDRALLQASARPLDAQAWDPQAGLGTLDAERFLELRGAATSTSPLDPARSRASLTAALVSRGEVVGLVVRAFRVDGSAPSRADVRVEGVTAGELRDGVARLVLVAPLDGSPGASWDAHVVVTTDDGASVSLVAHARFTSHTTDTLTPAGGCSAGGRAGGSVAPWAALVLLLSVARSRSRSPSRASRRGTPGASRP